MPQARDNAAALVDFRKAFEEKPLRRKGLEKRCKLSDLPAALILASRPLRRAPLAMLFSGW